MAEGNISYFSEVYNCFLSKITDDMYMEMTPADTLKDLQRLLITAIPGFEFPRVCLDYNILTETIESSQVTEDDFVTQTFEEEGVSYSVVDRSSFIYLLR